MAARKITLPLTEELAKTLHAGDSVLVTGTIYTSRDAGHKRMCESLAKGEKIPFDHDVCRRKRDDRKRRASSGGC